MSLKVYLDAYEESYNISNNTSNVKVSIKAVSNGTYNNNGMVFTVGAGSQSNSVTLKVYNGSTVTHAVNFTISHNNDGTGSVACFGSVVTNVSGKGTITPNNVNVTLTTIPRASTLSCSAFSQSSPATMGNSCAFIINRASESFTHTITYYWGNDTWSTNGTICEKTGGTSVSWTPPKDFARAIPSANIGVGNITLKTYSGGTEVGSQSYSFYCDVPLDIEPTIDSYGVGLDNSTNSNIEDWGLYVAGYSKAIISATASGAYGSSISGFTISGGYSATIQGVSPLTHTTGVLTSGDKSFEVAVTDSRRRSSEAVTVGSIHVYPYSKPEITIFSVTRDSSDTTQVTVKANWEFSDVDGKNRTIATLEYKKSSDSRWTTYGEINQYTDTDGWLTIDGDDGSVILTDISELSSYNFRLTVTDTVGNSITQDAFISTLDVLLDFKAGGTGIGIGKIAETDGTMEVNLDAYFMKDIYVQDKSEDGIKISILDAVYPVGSIYMSVNNKSPETLLGGTWEQIQDRFLLAAGSKTAGATGGSETHKHELPFGYNTQTGLFVRNDEPPYPIIDKNGSGHSIGLDQDLSNTSMMFSYTSPSDNMPPYLAVYMWKRTA